MTLLVTEMMTAVTDDEIANDIANDKDDGTAVTDDGRVFIIPGLGRLQNP